MIPALDDIVLRHIDSEFTARLVESAQPFLCNRRLFSVDKCDLPVPLIIEVMHQPVRTVHIVTHHTAVIIKRIVYRYRGKLTVNQFPHRGACEVHTGDQHPVTLAVSAVFREGSPADRLADKRNVIPESFYRILRAVQNLRKIFMGQTTHGLVLKYDSDIMRDIGLQLSRGCVRHVMHLPGCPQDPLRRLFSYVSVAVQRLADRRRRNFAQF